MNKYVVEFIGTFFLVLVIGLTVLGGGAGAVAPVAIGSVLTVMVYAGGGISGAHYNPAVTLAVWMRGKCATKDVAPYMTAQIVAAIVAGLTATYLKNNPFVTAPTPDIPRALLNEFLFTFALATVVLHTTTAKRSAGNNYYGLAIGFTVLAGAYAGGAISGGAYNPAVAVGISVMGLSAWSSIWIFPVANFAGGAAAALVFKLVEEAG